MQEKTFLMLKPDAVNRNLIFEITQMITNHQLTIEAFDVRIADVELLKEHYADVIKKVDPKLEFEKKMINTFQKQTVIPMIVSGEDAVKRSRDLIGFTEPIKADPESIRGKYGMNDSYKEADSSDRLINNLIHGSDCIESAQREINLWFHQ